MGVPCGDGSRGAQRAVRAPERNSAESAFATDNGINVTDSAAEIWRVQWQEYDVRTGRKTTAVPSSADLPYPGILLNNLKSDQNASAYITAPSRKGAPGSSIGAFGDVK